MTYKELSQYRYLDESNENDQIEAERIHKFIDNISDKLTRRIFALRFIDGKSWVRISLKIGGGNTADGIRKRVYRYLKQQ